jgi:hypothetical protein
LSADDPPTPVYDFSITENLSLGAVLARRPNRGPAFWELPCRIELRETFKVLFDLTHLKFLDPFQIDLSTLKAIELLENVQGAFE